MTFEEMALRAGYDTRRYLWRVSEVADITGVPSRTLRAEILAGRLVAISLTHRPRPKYVTAEAVNVWLREEWY